MTTSSSEITNASIAPAAIPGIASGSTTRRKACNGVAPRSAAASTRRLSNAVSRALTTTTTNAMQNVTCAAITVLMLSCTCANRLKNAVSETPITISGMTSEMKISVEYPDRPRNLNRVSANAPSVPMTVARNVAMIATFSVLRNACSAAGV